MQNQKVMAPMDSEIVTLARVDRARYLCVLAAPYSKRMDLLTLLAFDQEISRIPALVSEPMLGRIRLQWWLDELPRMDGGPDSNHPLIQALKSLTINYNDLMTMVEARNLDLDDKPLTLEQRVSYAYATGGMVWVLMGKCLGIDDNDVENTICDVGTAWTLIRMLGHGDDDLGDDVEAQSIQQYAIDLIQKARNQCISGKAFKTALPLLTLGTLTERRIRLGIEANEGAGAILSIWACRLRRKF